jgi:hypothetical protein
MALPECEAHFKKRKNGNKRDGQGGHRALGVRIGLLGFADGFRPYCTATLSKRSL